jgi:hypothetical protein
MRRRQAGRTETYEIAVCVIEPKDDECGFYECHERMSAISAAVGNWSTLQIKTVRIGPCRQRRTAPYD